MAIGESHRGLIHDSNRVQDPNTRLYEISFVFLFFFLNLTLVSSLRIVNNNNNKKTILDEL